MSRSRNFTGGTVTVLRRQAGGGFAQEAGSPIAVGPQASSVASGDFNLDGRPDLAVTNQNAGTVTILLRTTTGGFAQEGEPLETGTYPHEVVVAQLDSDFGPDLAVSNQRSGTVAILLRQAGGGFAPAPGSPIAVGETPLGLAATDFDGDDDPDLAVANGGSDTISILFNQPLGFTPGFTLTAGDEPYGLAAGDFDRDGRADLAVSHSRGSTIGVWLRTDAGFTQGYGSPVGDVYNPLRLAAADLDRDGRIDLAIPNHNAGTVALWRNVRGTRITSGPDGMTNDATPTFTFESDALDATFQCALDGGPFADCETPFTTEPLADGPHEFSVRALGDPDAGHARVHRRYDPARDDHHVRPRGRRHHHPELRVRVQRSRLAVRVPRGRDAVRRLRPAGARVGRRAGRLRVPGPRDRPRGQRRSFPRGARVRAAPAAARGPAAAQRRAPDDSCRRGRAGLHLHAGRVGERRRQPGYEYRWYRAYSFAPHVLVGTGSSYTVPQAYVGFTFYCVVTAQNAFGSGTGYSKWGILSGLPVRAGRDQGRRLRQRRRARHRRLPDRPADLRRARPTASPAVRSPGWRAAGHPRTSGPEARWSGRGSVCPIRASRSTPASRRPRSST